MSDPFPGFDPGMFANVPLFRELAKIMAWRGGPVNWDLAVQTAMAVAAPTGDDPVSGVDAELLREAADVAQLWLDQVTALPRQDAPVRALGRAEWVRLACTAEGLGLYVEPVAAGMSTALGRSLGEQLGQLGQAGADPAAAGGPFAQALGSLGAMLYGVQIGTVAGHLAGQLLGTFDLGLPTAGPAVVGSVGDSAVAFGRDYAFDERELRYWLALSEAAHQRVYSGVGWLRGHVAELIRRFAAEAEFDPGAMLEQFGGLGFDPQAAMSDPDELRRALEAPDAFRVEPTAGQRRTLDELQALVSFTEGWAAVVVAEASGGRLSALPRIQEAIRRRRAEQGPGERFLDQLVGLDLRPADLRAGEAFCTAVVAARGFDGLDRAWADPAALPSTAELAEPSRWLVRMAARELGPAQ